ncbi:hypothetical protein ACU4GG_21595 [Streptomyces nojiriensis]
MLRAGRRRTVAVPVSVAAVSVTSVVVAGTVTLAGRTTGVVPWT